MSSLENCLFKFFLPSFESHYLHLEYYFVLPLACTDDLCFIIFKMDFFKCYESLNAHIYVHHLVVWGLQRLKDSTGSIKGNKPWLDRWSLLPLATLAHYVLL